MGKSFDLFVTHKNQFPEELRKRIANARLFEFDMFPTESLPASYYKDVPDLAYNFCLPFSTVAVEDKTSCVILWDQQKNAVGIEHGRGMMEIADSRNYLEEESFRLSSQDRLRGRTEKDNIESRNSLREMAEAMGEYPLMLRWGTGSINWVDDRQQWLGHGRVKGALYWFQKSGRVMDILKSCALSKELSDALDMDYMRGMITAYEELLQMSVRTHFILETRPKKTTKSKYRKSHERPVYTVVRPSQARKSMSIPDPKRSKKRSIRERRAHIRREHKRELRSEVFKNKQGQTVEVKRAYIPAVWEGPSESEDNSHIYRVLLDLPKDLRESCS